VYHSENPRAFKQHKVIRGVLGVYWKSNHKAWVTRQLFHEWAYEVSCPSVEKYLTKNKIEVKALLLLNNACGHDPELVSSLTAKFPSIKANFLLPNTTCLIKSVDQQVIANFKRLYIKKALNKCSEAASSE
jgi:hypothetical protein